MRGNSQTQKVSVVNPLIEALMERPSNVAVSSKLTDLPIMPDALSAEELALASGVGVKTIREKLKGLLADGQLIVGRKQSKDLLGRDIWVPAYTYKKTE